jgi:hypothetical protein
MPPCREQGFNIMVLELTYYRYVQTVGAAMISGVLRP